MTDAERLNKVKAMLMITGSYHDAALSAYIDEAINYMTSAGVALSVAQLSTSVGLISGIVSDLFQADPGKSEISAYNKSRVIQLCYKDADTPDPADNHTLLSFDN